MTPVTNMQDLSLDTIPRKQSQIVPEIGEQDQSHINLLNQGTRTRKRAKFQVLTATELPEPDIDFKSKDAADVKSSAKDNPYSYKTEFKKHWAISVNRNDLP